MKSQMLLVITGCILSIALAGSLEYAYADNLTATVSMPAGTGIQGCEETNECFIPADVSVDVGGEVTWSNDDTVAHTVTSGSNESGGPDGKFNSGLFLAGTTFSVTFDEAGEYPYYCLVHPWRVGSVTVVDGINTEPVDLETIVVPEVDLGAALIEQLVDLIRGYQAEIQRLSDSVEYWQDQAADLEYVIEIMEEHRQENEILESQNHNSTRILELEAERDDLADQLNTTNSRFIDMQEENNRLDMENQLNAIRVQTLQDEVDRLNVLLESNTNIDPGPVTLQTDRSHYVRNDTITVTGQVPYIEDGNTPIILQVFRPDGSTPTLDQLFVRSDGTFITTLDTGGSQWNENGTYTIRAEYGIIPIRGETTFEFQTEIELVIVTLSRLSTQGETTFEFQTEIENTPAPQELVVDIQPAQSNYTLGDDLTITIEAKDIFDSASKEYSLGGQLLPAHGDFFVTISSGSIEDRAIYYMENDWTNAELSAKSVTTAGDVWNGFPNATLTDNGDLSWSVNFEITEKFRAGTYVVSTYYNWLVDPSSWFSTVSNFTVG